MAAAQFLHESPSGHLLSNARWLDSHYEACRPEYEQLLDFVPITAGMSVLDAGSGPGPFIPAIRRQVGREGKVECLDFDAANVSMAWERLQGALDAAVVGSVLALPFRDGSFDAAWCANTAQYFAGRDLHCLLSELKRVVQKGGIVAVKDVDMTGFRILPSPPLLGAHLAETALSGPDVTPQSVGSLRGRELRRLLEETGLRNVRQRSVLIERWGPLSGADLEFWTEWLPYLAAVAENHGVPEEDRVVWERVRTPEMAATFVTRPDFYGCELQVVAYGIVEAPQ
jgi:ubiquinone/menaquinone biosynthesis C-methylase UbiE